MHTARTALQVANSGAILSDCGRFRYMLHRQWDLALPALLFVMLNPSTADSLFNDPTIRRCATFALAHGYGDIEVVNLFAYRATDPADLRRAGYLVGPDNDFWITGAAEQAVERSAPVCLAWESNVAGLERPQVVLPMLRRVGAALRCLRITRSGYPQHPLMLPSECRLMPFDEAAIQNAMHGATA